MKIPLCQLTLLDRGFLPVGHVLRMRRGPGREPVTAQRRHQVTDIAPAPAPKITEYVAQAKECAGCGTVTAGELPAHVRAQASYGPETCAQAANLAIGHIPIYRATLLLCQLAGIAVSTGWMAGIRGKAQALAASGLAANLCRRTATVKDARRLARRFRSFEDMILRFAARPDLDIFSITKPSGPSGPSRSSNAAPEAAGGHVPDSPSSH